MILISTRMAIVGSFWLRVILPKNMSFDIGDIIYIRKYKDKGEFLQKTIKRNYFKNKNSFIKYIDIDRKSNIQKGDKVNIYIKASDYDKSDIK